MPVNGWTEPEIERLMRRTGRPRELVERFCRAVDKRLFLMLDERQRRATLHFHLDPPDEKPARSDG
jgi:hypothetical protein